MERCVVVLVVGEERVWRDEVARMLREEGYIVAPWTSGDPAEILAHVVADLLLIDVAGLGATLALDAISAVSRAQPSIRVLCVGETGKLDSLLGGVCTASVSKPHRRDQLLLELDRTLRP